MHEYHGAVEVIEHAEAHCKERGHSKVTKIQLVIGEASGYSFEVVKVILRKRLLEQCVKGQR